ncbi:substrate-binding periplasmic protein [Rheinheimera sp. SA_1]|uniref:substrate-binding periplasmic protein n=1 Tax=Rheinheimera sp. SA_1 TaxID=1827365 RepID=UPI000ABFF970|nr:ABC transporter substrate-binding protein [Rheinheimera sp. SA_1]
MKAIAETPVPQPKLQPQLIVFGYPHQIVDPLTLYPIRLLRAALEKSGEPFALQASPVPMVQDRSLREIAAGNLVDVFWSMTSIEREQYLLPVRIPIDKGLFGWRVFLTTEKNQHLTETVQTIAQLKKLVILQGHDWPDTKILQSNKLKVITSNQYRSMFNMIATGRAELFPRSILEVWKEIALEKHNLRVDPRLSIYYPTALYFFVSKSQPELAKRIEKGLNQMIASGEFEQLFLEEYGADLAEAVATKRRVIYLENPFLPKETPLTRKELWVDLEALVGK